MMFRTKRCGATPLDGSPGTSGSQRYTRGSLARSRRPTPDNTSATAPPAVIPHTSGHTGTVSRGPVHGGAWWGAHVSTCLISAMPPNTVTSDLLI
jgi:hypothetical protein